MFETVDVSAARRMGKPEGLERSESKAIGLRAFIGQQQAIVSTTDIHEDALSELAERAVAMAKATPADPDSTLAPESLLCQRHARARFVRCGGARYGVAYRTMRAKPKKRRSRWRASPIPKAPTRITARTASASPFITARNNRFAHSYPTSHFSVSVSVLAGEGTSMERDYDFTSARHIRDLEDAASHRPQRLTARAQALESA